VPTRRTAQLESLAADLAEHAYPLARAATSAVAAEQQHRLAFGDRRHARDQFIAQLLLGAQANEDYLLRQAQIMGMDLSRPRAVILLDSGIDCSPEDVERVIRRIVQFFHLPNDTICGYLGANEVVVLKAASNRDLQSWTRAADPAAAGGASWANLRALKRAAGELATQLRRDGVRPAWIGVGRYHPGLPGLGLSYRDARAALALGPRYAPGRTVYALDEIGLGAWIGAFDETTRVDLAI
jgi:carbohydrate diacid regulator